MNILHMKYAVEVARAGSLSKASEKLLIAQPNLSRAVKELESDLGITIFDRSTRGMLLTPEGEEFVRYASEILNRIDEVEKTYRRGAAADRKLRFSISVPRASYISEAFSAFASGIEEKQIELFYKETNSYRAINNILSSDYGLGIIRYAEKYDRYFKEMLEEKGLVYELVADFHHVLVMRKDSPLAEKAEIFLSDLRPHIEIAHGDPFVPSLPAAQVMKEETEEEIKKRIYVFERASQFELLAENKMAFMWASPVPQKLLTLYGLIQRVCPDNSKIYKDVLIYRKDHTLTELDKGFITELCRSRRKCFSGAQCISERMPVVPCFCTFGR